jgi:hypothetical protein
VSASGTPRSKTAQTLQGVDILDTKSEIAMDLEISKAWVAAAADLGIRVVAPFALSTESGELLWFEAHIANFGGPNGTVVGNQDTGSCNTRQRLGYYPSNLYPRYQTYDRQLFIDTLNDWGWFGEKGKEPSWYTGEAWSC